MATIKDNKLVVLGETNFRNQRWRFGIKEDDRRRHMYVVGSTGMGKTEFLKNMAIQDIEAGRGIAYIDPHGDAVDDILDHIPEHRIKDVVYFDPGDLEFPVSFNVMEDVDFDYRHLVASGLVGVFKKIWGVEAWSGRMEYILNNTILALLEYPDSTLLGINRLMSNKEYRKKVVSNLKDPIVKSFWVEEFAKYADKFATEATAAIQNKVGQFSSNNLIRNIIGQSKSKLDIRKIMDEGKILLANVSRGKIGEDASRLLGAFLVTKIQLAAMSRVDIPERERKDFYLYVDEFQHFATESFANILSEARKFHLSLVMAHQYIKQMEEPVRDAVFGNVGTIVSFRVGAEDAEFLEKWFSPDFLMGDIVNLGKYSIYLKLMIDGISSKGFSAATMPPFPKLEKSNRDQIIEYSRSHYANPRATVEKDVAEWAGIMENNQPVESSRGSSYGGSNQKQERQDRPERQREESRPRYNNQGSYGSMPNESDRRQQNFGQQDRPMRQEFRREEPRREERRPESNQAQPFQSVSNNRSSGPRTIGLEPRRMENTPSSKTLASVTNNEVKPTYQPPTKTQDNSSELSLGRRPGEERGNTGHRDMNTGLSLEEALKQGPVNFRGRKIEEKRERPKVEVNTSELRKALEEAMGK